ncbi:MAG: hypothetical protein M3326_06435 [Actinomycetota bacterium]|nr:hypothetical protein [Actinomycetota bacterium]
MLSGSSTPTRCSPHRAARAAGSTAAVAMSRTVVIRSGVVTAARTT